MTHHPSLTSTIALLEQACSELLMQDQAIAHKFVETAKLLLEEELATLVEVNTGQMKTGQAKTDQANTNLANTARVLPFPKLERA